MAGRKKKSELWSIPGLLEAEGRVVVVTKSYTTYHSLRRILRVAGMSGAVSAIEKERIYVWLPVKYPSYTLTQSMMDEMEMSAPKVVIEEAVLLSGGSATHKNFSDEEVKRVVAERLKAMEEEKERKESTGEVLKRYNPESGDRIEKKDPAKCRKAVENYMKPSEE